MSYYRPVPMVVAWPDEQISMVNTIAGIEKMFKSRGINPGAVQYARDQQGIEIGDFTQGCDRESLKALLRDMKHRRDPEIIHAVVPGGQVVCIRLPVTYGHWKGKIL